MVKPSRQNIAVATALTVWAVAAFGGIGLMMAASRRPDPAAVAGVWPAGVALSTVAGRPTLVTFLHPRCPCSDATLDAIDGLIEHAAVTAIAVFAVPEAAGAGWTDAPLVRRARAMAGLTVVLDAGGRTCATFDARSSGQTFLFDAAGRLRFAGGLTPGRGEAGDSPGADRVRSLLAGRPDDRSILLKTAVFGCALFRTSTNEASQ